MRPILNVVWNIFLALIPVAVAWILVNEARRKRVVGEALSKRVAIPALLVWIAFLPNTCYLVTEWRHYLETITSNPSIFRLARHSPHYMLNFLMMTAFYAAYSGVGVITYFMAIWPIDRWLKPSRAIKAAFFFLCSLGVYLGLIRRLNSWDILHHPLHIVRDALVALSSPALGLLILGFGVALWALYFLFSLTVDGLRQRIEGREQATVDD